MALHSDPISKAIADLHARAAASKMENCAIVHWPIVLLRHSECHDPEWGAGG